MAAIVRMREARRYSHAGNTAANLPGGIHAAHSNESGCFPWIPERAGSGLPGPAVGAGFPITGIGLAGPGV